MKTLKVLLVAMLLMAIASPAKAAVPWPNPTELVTIEKVADKEEYCPGEIIEYTITISNSNDNPDYGVTVNELIDILPDGTVVDVLSMCGLGESIYLGPLASLSTGPCLTYTVPGDAEPGVITNNVFCLLKGDWCNEFDKEAHCDVQVIPCNPNSKVTITANGSDESITVCEGEEVTLTICEENTGDVDLFDILVVVNDGIFDIGTFGAPVLPVGEKLCWDLGGPVNVPTTFTATGYGTDPVGNVITFPEYPEEKDEVTVETKPCDGEAGGCTPGFWKNNADKHKASAWCGLFSPEMRISDVIFLNELLVIRGKGKRTITDPTLLQALDANGGGVNAMIRHGVAAMLNACSDCVNYPIFDPFEIIFMIQDALNGAPGAYTVDELHTMFASWNGTGCPINQHGKCVGIED